MAAYLHITVRFLAGSHHGAQWPPAPATLFQALVSGGYTGAASLAWGEPESEALQWLECLPPPSITARQKEDGQPYRLFVPINNLDKSAHAEATKAKVQIKPETLKTSKEVHPHLLPPALQPGESSVVYSWPLSALDPPEIVAHAATLDSLTSRLTALGWGVDFAAAQAHLSPAPAVPPGESGWQEFTPAPSGTLSLHVPAPGFLHSLYLRFNAFRSRISPDGLNPTLPPAALRVVPYRLLGLAAPRPVIQLDLLPADPAKNWLSKPWAKSMHVAGWLRHAAAEALREENFPEEFITEFICGHAGQDDRGHRLSYLPLPSIGAHHTDGFVRRALIAAPDTLSPLELDAFEMLRLKLPGGPILEETEPDPTGFFDSPANPETVYPFYLNSANVWDSVTPVILPGFNTLRRQLSIEKTERLLIQSLQNAGHPAHTIAGLEYQPAPYWSGAAAASRIFVPKHLERWPRLHVRVVFSNPIAGPLSIGLGRHYGIGLFARSRE